jgi:tetratricopeptide (TPR) repeat protein
MSVGPNVCAACGARMKAHRLVCLHCGATLTNVDAVVALSDGSAHFSRRATIAVSIVASIVVLALVGVLWGTGAAGGPAPVGREIVAAALAPAAAAPAANDMSAPAAIGYESATFLDQTRSGGAAFISGDFEAARTEYESALAKRPDDADALNALGQALVRLGRVDDAIARFERAVQLAPDAWAPHFNLAAAAAQRGQWDRAIDQYREAARVFADDYATQFNLALALHKKGDEPAAIAEYEKAIRLAPGEPSFHVALAVSLEKTGRIDQAVREYRLSLDMDPDSAAAANLRTHIDALTQVLHSGR